MLKTFLLIEKLILKPKGKTNLMGSSKKKTKKDIKKIEENKKRGKKE